MSFEWCADRNNGVETSNAAVTAELASSPNVSGATLGSPAAQTDPSSNTNGPKLGTSTGTPAVSDATVPTSLQEQKDDTTFDTIMTRTKTSHSLFTDLAGTCRDEEDNETLAGLIRDCIVQVTWC